MKDEVKRLLFTEEPRPDESFAGYLLRLTQLNDYDKLSWLLQMSRIKGGERRSPCVSFDRSLNLAPLSTLSGVDEAKLAALQYHPVRVSASKMMGDYSVFGSPLPHHLIRLKYQKICPACLREDEYIRKVWDLAPVTTCPLHKCLLLDKCPLCRNPIVWNRHRISLCRCEFDWREHVRSEVEDSELTVTRQIHLLCHLPIGLSKSEEAIDNNPLYKLGLRQFVLSLLFVASQFANGVSQRKYHRVIDTKGKHLVPSRSNAEVHELLCKSLRVFDNWPDNYFSFLDERRAQQGSDESSTAKRNYFEGYKHALLVQLASPDFEFMRSAFREYRRIRLYDSYLAGRDDPTECHEKAGQRALCTEKVGNAPVPEQARTESVRLYETHVSGKEARKALKISWPGLEKVIASGRLRAIVGSYGEKRVFLIEKASLEDLKAKLETALSLEEIQRLLGVHAYRVRELIECGLLNPLRGPDIDGNGDWYFERGEVVNLIERLARGLPRKRKFNKKKVLGFKAVMVKVGRVGVGLGEFLQAVLSGEVKPIGRTQDAGLQCLVFANYVIDEYWHGKFKLLAGDVLTIREAARLLGVTLDATYLLVKKGFLRAEKSVNTRSLGLVVRRSELDSFTETYLLAKEVAREHDTSQKRIVELFRRGGVSPISGPEAARRHIYLFNRVDLASLDWEHLVEIERKSRAAAKQLSSYIYDEQRVAEMLNTDVVTVRLMAKRGVLKPYKHLLPDGRNGGTYCFSRAVLQRYKKQAGDLTGLVAYQAAVRLFGVKLDTFRNKFVKTGRLKPAIAASGGSKRFFNAEDVEALLEVEKLTIMTAETAKILGVKLSGVDKLMTSGDLKPISGPTVDGFGKNLFLRSNVEKLRMERDSFKANQVQAGKSNRFGRTAGPRSRPVRDLIGPRIDQLIETWQQQTPNLRITGQRLYQQLTSEGYQVGINTIYVHLRKDRWRGEGVSRF